MGNNGSSYRDMDYSALKVYHNQSRLFVRKNSTLISNPSLIDREISPPKILKIIK